MTITINVNGLTLVHKGSEGVAKATLPNICLTPVPGGPPVPMNYSNTAYSKDLAKGTVTITADGGNMCAHRGSEFSKSTGDEAGVLGGIFSGTHSAEATWLTWSPDVILEGKNACRLTDKMLMNHGNTACLAGEEQTQISASDLLDKFLECHEAKKLYDKAKEANGGKDPTILKDASSEIMSGGSVDPTNGIIRIDEVDMDGKAYSEFDQIETLGFELSNLSRKKDFMKVEEEYLPSKGKLNSPVKREQYIRGKERVEFETAKEAEKISDACKEQWGHPDGDSEYKGSNNRSFYQHYMLLSPDHKNQYGRQWDEVLERIIAQ